jgi:DNA polymerase-3 subunit delta'
VSFASVHTHDIPKEIFAHAVKNDRLGHAYLLSGPDGVGKKRFAYAAATALLCEDAPAGESCGSCTSCQRVDHRAHTNILHLSVPEDKTGIPIESVRGLEENLKLRPFESGARIIIVEEMDRMRREAMDAFLKTLEEPPPNTVFFLTTAFKDRLPETIMSRCQLLTFSPIPLNLLSRELISRLQINEEDAHTLAAMAEGSLGRALELNEDGILDRLDMIPRLFDQLQDGQVGLLSADMMSRIESGKADARLQRTRFQREVDLLLFTLRGIYRNQMHGGHQAEPTRPLPEPLERFGRRNAPGKILGKIDQLMELRKGTYLNFNTKLLVEQVLLDLAV